MIRNTTASRARARGTAVVVAAVIAAGSPAAVSAAAPTIDPLADPAPSTTSTTTSPPSSPTTVSVPATPPPEHKVAAAQRRGQAMYDTGDFDGAIEAWTSAYALSLDSNRGADAGLLLQIADAHERAFEAGGGAEHLTKARASLQTIAREAEAGTAIDPAVVREANERLAALDADPSATAATTSFPVTTNGRAPVGGYLWISDTGPPPTQAQIDRNLELSRQSKVADGLIIVGGTFVTLAAPSILFGGILATDPDLRRPMLGLVFTGVALAGAGTGILVAGLLRRKRIQREAAENERRSKP